jgi:hypothetical protein
MAEHVRELNHLPRDKNKPIFSGDFGGGNVQV